MYSEEVTYLMPYSNGVYFIRGNFLYYDGTIRPSGFLYIDETLEVSEFGVYNKIEIINDSQELSK